MLSTHLYTGYGGARGGGKTHVLMRKAISLAMEYHGIKILIMRRTYPELETTLIQPMNALIATATMNGKPAGDRIATYNSTLRTLFFATGSIIRFGHLQSAKAVDEYQGAEYDIVFLDEATHFTEWEFRVLGATLRGVNDFPKRMYLTCNPGGIGHYWVKRLFVSREYEADKHENPADYIFIPATVDDNTALLKASPGYIAMLDTLPEDKKAAWRYGDWDAMAGQYFSEYRTGVHTVADFPIPDSWPRYRCFDYGLDMFACLWFAVDEHDRVYVYRERFQSGLIVSQAADLMKRATPPGEKIEFTIAPPDMWSTMKDTGKTMAEIFQLNGINLVKASNQRVQGWAVVKDGMKTWDDGKAGIVFFESLTRITSDIQAIQHDEKNPDDCAKEPHDITHGPDALRYGMVARKLGAEPAAEDDEEDDEDGGTDYKYFMTGGAPSQSYMAC